MRLKKAPPPITALILAGGAGRRVNGRDKGLIPYRGKPLVEHVRERVEGGVERVLVSCNRNSARYRPYADELVHDSRADFQGPLAGIESAIPLVLTPLLLVVPCDTPFLPEDLTQRLLCALRDAPQADLAYACCPERDHYLCALLHRDCLETLGPFMNGGERAVHRWYASLEAVAVKFADSEAFANRNRDLR